MEKVCEYDFQASRFPIKHTFNTGVTQVQLNIPDVITHREIEDQFLNQVLSKYSSVVICRLLHYVLAEKCVLIEGPDRRALN